MRKAARSRNMHATIYGRSWRLAPPPSPSPRRREKCENVTSQSLLRSIAVLVADWPVNPQNFQPRANDLPRLGQLRLVGCRATSPDGFGLEVFACKVAVLVESYLPAKRHPGVPLGHGDLALSAEIVQPDHAVDHFGEAAKPDLNRARQNPPPPHLQE